MTGSVIGASGSSPAASGQSRRGAHDGRCLRRQLHLRRLGCDADGIPPPPPEPLPPPPPGPGSPTPGVVVVGVVLDAAGGLGRRAVLAIAAFTFAGLLLDVSSVVIVGLGRLAPARGFAGCGCRRLGLSPAAWSHSAVVGDSDSVLSAGLVVSAGLVLSAGLVVSVLRCHGLACRPRLRLRPSRRSCRCVLLGVAVAASFESPVAAGLRRGRWFGKGQRAAETTHEQAGGHEAGRRGDVHTRTHSSPPLAALPAGTIHWSDDSCIRISRRFAVDIKLLAIGARRCGKCHGR